ncbi:hypothetical protein GCM10022381_13250 [Leifsonia kafniensis]|uniref:Uncharacterized protein n=1 Tax=Leifsonia kafniensis TaxID=475957 RepID=A0ABP7KAV1_9MICO
MTIHVEDFRPEFIEWLRRADHTIGRSDSDRIAIAPRGGEWVYFLAEIQGGWIRVTRSDRGGDEGWEFDAASLEVIEHHFTADVGNIVRSRSGISGDVRLPTRAKELASGASLHAVTEGENAGREELVLNGEILGVFKLYGRDFHPAVAASVYCSGSLAEIRESFLDPEGRPLFGLK